MVEVQCTGSITIRELAMWRYRNHSGNYTYTTVSLAENTIVRILTKRDPRLHRMTILSHRRLAADCFAKTEPGDKRKFSHTSFVLWIRSPIFARPLASLLSVAFLFGGIVASVRKENRALKRS